VQRQIGSCGPGRSRAVRFVVLACLTLAACHTMRPVQPSDITISKPIPRIWVTRVDNSTAVLELPILHGDTLNGLVMGEPELIPLSDTRSITARRSAPGKTAGLAVVSGAAALGLLFYMESRPDVGNGRVCLASLGPRPNFFTNCCTADDTLPC